MNACQWCGEHVEDVIPNVTEVNGKPIHRACFWQRITSRMQFLSQSMYRATS